MPGVRRGVEHERADGVVAAQVPPDLLLHQLGGFRAQHRPGSALMGFEFVEDALDFPTLRVSTGEFGRTGLVGVQNRRQQPILLGIVAAVVDRVVDNSDIQRRCAARGLAPEVATMRASHDPSGSVSTWRGRRVVFTRHSRSAPVPAA